MQVRALEEIILNLNALNTTDWVQGQDKDDILLRVKSLILSQTKPSKKEQANENSEVSRYIRDWGKLSLKNGSICRSAVIKRDTYQQLMIPKNIIDIVFMLVPLWESVIVLCFVVRYFMSILVLQSS